MLLLTSFLGGALGSIVVWLLAPREIAVRDVEASQELTSAMNTLSTELSREKMRKVRAAAGAAASSVPQTVAPPNVSPLLTKEQLRQAFRQRNQAQ